MRLSFNEESPLAKSGKKTFCIEETISCHTTVQGLRVIEYNPNSAGPRNFPIERGIILSVSIERNDERVAGNEMLLSSLNAALEK